ncbi:hypothetical protein DSO57_1026923 [Entomophthora muscae]|uniref:Uncharacterized protein n=1 Tax=Entomophthora muscae TaxID=34485 RepID=A0ACC2S491_9FUNG|nr:hypothetical protein DSO57_1026923 [Entomophthora muscae]
MSIFFSNSACTQLSSFYCTSNTIMACCLSLNILGVYFKRSLSKEEVQHQLFSCTKAEIVISDAKLQYGLHWGGLNTGSLLQQDVLFQYCTKFDLQHVRPAEFCPQNDHVYVQAQLMNSYLAKPVVIFSDHHSLHVEITLASLLDVAPVFRLERYHL